MAILKKGKDWEARFDSGRWMGVLKCVGSEIHAVGYWWISQETFEHLNDDNARDLIRAGHCIYTFEDIRSVGISVRIFEADWKRLIQWHYLSDVVSDRGDYVCDYVRGTYQTGWGKQAGVIPDHLKSDGVNVPFP